MPMIYSSTMVTDDKLNRYEFITDPFGRFILQTVNPSGNPNFYGKHKYTITAN